MKKKLTKKELLIDCIQGALFELNKACDEDEFVNHNREIGIAVLLLTHALYGCEQTT